MLSIPSFIAPNLWAKGAQNLAPRDEESVSIRDRNCSTTLELEETIIVRDESCDVRHVHR